MIDLPFRRRPEARIQRRLQEFAGPTAARLTALAACRGCRIAKAAGEDYVHGHNLTAHTFVRRAAL